MDFNEYQVAANIFRNTNADEVANYALGMVCEAGEVGDILKKHIFHGHTLNTNELIKEMGDTLWYMTNLCTVLDIDLEEVALQNIKKLKERYPNGFSKNDSINRKE